MEKVVRDVMLSEAGLELIALVFTLLWGWFRGTEWFAGMRARIKQSRWEKAMALVEAGAEKTYRSFVASLKEANGGKLTPEQQRQAQDQALAEAQRMGQRIGVDVLQVLTPDLARVAVVAAVHKLKGKVAGWLPG
jgi:hypothetical protein